MLCPSNTRPTDVVGECLVASRSASYHLFYKNSARPRSWDRPLNCLAMGLSCTLGIPVAYLLAADIVSGPLPIRLREVNQPVIITRNWCSSPPSTPLDLHLSPLSPSTIRSLTHAGF
jgi:hypothetical protein